VLAEALTPVGLERASEVFRLPVADPVPLGSHPDADAVDARVRVAARVNALLQKIIDEATAPWGMKVSIVEVRRRRSSSRRQST
jgi:regulator of protease activity HflC (stomatin/prohibitin superfamily)